MSPACTCGFDGVPAEPPCEVHDGGAWFTCPHCEGRGASAVLTDGARVAMLCTHCNGEGRRWANQDLVEAAHQIGSRDPFCVHEWAYDGDEEQSSRCYCTNCGADGDA